jgi:hypothetical protein
VACSQLQNWHTDTLVALVRCWAQLLTSQHHQAALAHRTHYR